MAMFQAQQQPTGLLAAGQQQRQNNTNVGGFPAGPTAPTMTATSKTGATPANPTGLFSVGNTFGGNAQAAYDQFYKNIGTNQPSYAGIAAGPNATSFSADRQRIETEMFNRAKSDLDLRYKQETDDFNQQMANQGVDIGSERYKRERELFDRSRNQAYSDARFDSISAGAAEQQRLFDMAMDTRKQGVTEANSLSEQRINNLAALVNPALAGQGVLNTREAAIRDDATRRYGVDVGAKTAKAGFKNDRRIKDKDRKHDTIEREKDRAVERARIAKMGAGGGDGGGLTPEQLGMLINMIPPASD